MIPLANPAPMNEHDHVRSLDDLGFPKESLQSLN